MDTDKLDQAVFEAQTHHLPDVLLSALILWSKEFETKTWKMDYLNAELKIRQDANRWLDEKWEWHIGASPVTNEQVKERLGIVKNLHGL